MVLWGAFAHRPDLMSTRPAESMVLPSRRQPLQSQLGEYLDSQANRKNISNQGIYQLKTTFSHMNCMMLTLQRQV